MKKDGDPVDGDMVNNDIDHVEAVGEGSSVGGRGKTIRKGGVQCKLPLSRISGFMSPPRVMCLFCDRSFLSAVLLQKHTNRCHRVTPARRTSARNTEQQATTTYNYHPGCNFCNSKAIQKADDLPALFHHLLDKHSLKYFGCRPCKQRFSDSNQLKSHNQIIHPELLETSISNSECNAKDVSKKYASVQLPASETNKEKVSSNSLQTSYEPFETDSCNVNARVLTKRVTLSTPSSDDNNKKELRSRKGSSKTRNSSVANSKEISTTPPDTRQLTTKEADVKNSSYELKNLQEAIILIPPPPKDGFKPIRKAAAEKDSVAESLDKKLSKMGRASVTLTPVQIKPNTNSDSQVLSRLGLVQNRSPRTQSVRRNRKAPSTETRSASEAYRRDKSKGKNDNEFIINKNRIDPSTKFDPDFYSTVSSNVRENLLKHLDGKLEKNNIGCDLPDIIDPKIKSTHAVLEEQMKQPAEIHGSDVALNAITIFPTLLSQDQYGSDKVPHYSYGANSQGFKKTITKNSWKWKWDITKKIKQTQDVGKRDLSRLDIWTQLTMRERYDKDISKVEDSDVDPDRAERQKQVNELNDILNRRVFPDIQNELKMSIRKDDEETVENVVEGKIDKTENKMEDSPSEKLDFMQALQLTTHDTASSESKQNVFSGEWQRPRCYVCCVCGRRADCLRLMEVHQATQHPCAQATYYELVGKEAIDNQLHKHLYIPGLRRHMPTMLKKVQASKKTHKIFKSGQSTRILRTMARNIKMQERQCTKCKKALSPSEIHKHILECAGDYGWMMSKKKCKSKPFGARRRRLKGLYKRERPQEEGERTEKDSTPRPKIPPRPRSKPSDVETIQRMLANLPAKRTSKQVLDLPSPKNRKVLNKGQSRILRRILPESSVPRNKTTVVRTIKNGKLRRVTRSIKAPEAANIKSRGSDSSLPGRRIKRYNKITEKSVSGDTPTKLPSTPDIRRIKSSPKGSNFSSPSRENVSSSKENASESPSKNDASSVATEDSKEDSDYSEKQRRLLRRRPENSNHIKIIRRRIKKINHIVDKTKHSDSSNLENTQDNSNPISPSLTDEKTESKLTKSNNNITKTKSSLPNVKRKSKKVLGLPLKWIGKRGRVSRMKKKIDNTAMASSANADADKTSNVGSDVSKMETDEDITQASTLKKQDEVPPMDTSANTDNGVMENEHTNASVSAPLPIGSNTLSSNEEKAPPLMTLANDPRHTNTNLGFSSYGDQSHNVNSQGQNPYHNLYNSTLQGGNISNLGGKTAGLNYSNALGYYLPSSLQIVTHSKHDKNYERTVNVHKADDFAIDNIDKPPLFSSVRAQSQAKEVAHHEISPAYLSPPLMMPRAFMHSDTNYDVAHSNMSKSKMASNKTSKRGLNDCIAMLRGKLTAKNTNDIESPVPAASSMTMGEDSSQYEDNLQPLDLSGRCQAEDLSVNRNNDMPENLTVPKTHNISDDWLEVQDLSMKSTPKTKPSLLSVRKPVFDPTLRIPQFSASVDQSVAKPSTSALSQSSYIAHSNTAANKTMSYPPNIVSPNQATIDLPSNISHELSLLPQALVNTIEKLPPFQQEEIVKVLPQVLVKAVENYNLLRTDSGKRQNEQDIIKNISSLTSTIELTHSESPATREEHIRPRPTALPQTSEISTQTSIVQTKEEDIPKCPPEFMNVGTDVYSITASIVERKIDKLPNKAVEPASILSIKPRPPHEVIDLTDEVTIKEPEEVIPAAIIEKPKDSETQVRSVVIDPAALEKSKTIEPSKPMKGTASLRAVRIKSTSEKLKIKNLALSESIDKPPPVGPKPISFVPQDVSEPVPKAADNKPVEEREDVVNLQQHTENTITSSKDTKSEGSELSESNVTEPSEPAIQQDEVSSTQHSSVEDNSDVSADISLRRNMSPLRQKLKDIQAKSRMALVNMKLNENAQSEPPSLEKPADEIPSPLAPVEQDKDASVVNVEKPVKGKPNTRRKRATKVTKEKKTIESNELNKLKENTQDKETKEVNPVVDKRDKAESKTTDSESDKKTSFNNLLKECNTLSESALTPSNVIDFHTERKALDKCEHVQMSEPNQDDTDSDRNTSVRRSLRSKKTIIKEAQATIEKDSSIFENRGHNNAVERIPDVPGAMIPEESYKANLGSTKDTAVEEVVKLPVKETLSKDESDDDDICLAAFSKKNSVSVGKLPISPEIVSDGTITDKIPSVIEDKPAEQSDSAATENVVTPKKVTATQKTKKKTNRQKKSQRECKTSSVVDAVNEKVVTQEKPAVPEVVDQPTQSENKDSSPVQLTEDTRLDDRRLDEIISLKASVEPASIHIENKKDITRKSGRLKSQKETFASIDSVKLSENGHLIFKMHKEPRDVIEKVNIFEKDAIPTNCIVDVHPIEEEPVKSVTKSKKTKRSKKECQTSQNIPQSSTETQEVVSLTEPLVPKTVTEETTIEKDLPHTDKNLRSPTKRRLLNTTSVTTDSQEVIKPLPEPVVPSPVVEEPSIDKDLPLADKKLRAPAKKRLQNIATVTTEPQVSISLPKAIEPKTVSEESSAASDSLLTDKRLRAPTKKRSQNIVPVASEPQEVTPLPESVVPNTVAEETTAEKEVVHLERKLRTPTKKRSQIHSLPVIEPQEVVSLSETVVPNIVSKETTIDKDLSHIDKKLRSPTKKRLQNVTPTPIITEPQEVTVLEPVLMKAVSKETSTENYLLNESKEKKSRLPSKKRSQNVVSVITEPQEVESLPESVVPKVIPEETSKENDLLHADKNVRLSGKKRSQKQKNIAILEDKNVIEDESDRPLIAFKKDANLIVDAEVVPQSIVPPVCSKQSNEASKLVVGTSELIPTNTEVNHENQNEKDLSSDEDIALCRLVPKKKLRKLKSRSSPRNISTKDTSAPIVSEIVSQPPSNDTSKEVPECNERMASPEIRKSSMRIKNTLKKNDSNVVSEIPSVETVTPKDDVLEEVNIQTVADNSVEIESPKSTNKKRNSRKTNTPLNETLSTEMLPELQINKKTSKPSVQNKVSKKTIQTKDILLEPSLKSDIERVNDVVQDTLVSCEPDIVLTPTRKSRKTIIIEEQQKQVTEVDKGGDVEVIPLINRIKTKAARKDETDIVVPANQRLTSPRRCVKKLIVENDLDIEPGTKLEPIVSEPSLKSDDLTEPSTPTVPPTSGRRSSKKCLFDNIVSHQSNEKSRNKTTKKSKIVLTDDSATLAVESETDATQPLRKPMKVLTSESSDTGAANIPKEVKTKASVKDDSADCVTQEISSPRRNLKRATQEKVSPLKVTDERLTEIQPNDRIDQRQSDQAESLSPLRRTTKRLSSNVDTSPKISEKSAVEIKTKALLKEVAVVKPLVEASVSLQSTKKSKKKSILERELLLEPKECEEMINEIATVTDRLSPRKSNKRKMSEAEPLLVDDNKCKVAVDESLNVEQVASVVVSQTKSTKKSIATDSEDVVDKVDEEPLVRSARKSRNATKQTSDEDQKLSSIISDEIDSKSIRRKSSRTSVKDAIIVDKEIVPDKPKPQEEDLKATSVSVEEDKTTGEPLGSVVPAEEVKSKVRSSRSSLRSKTESLQEDILNKKRPSISAEDSSDDLAALSVKLNSESTSKQKKTKHLSPKPRDTTPNKTTLRKEKKSSKEINKPFTKLTNDLHTTKKCHVTLDELDVSKMKNDLGDGTITYNISGLESPPQSGTAKKPDEKAQRVKENRSSITIASSVEASKPDVDKGKSAEKNEESKPIVESVKTFESKPIQTILNPDIIEASNDTNCGLPATPTERVAKKKLSIDSPRKSSSRKQIVHVDVHVPREEIKSDADTSVDIIPPPKSVLKEESNKKSKKHKKKSALKSKIPDFNAIDDDLSSEEPLQSIVEAGKFLDKSLSKYSEEEASDKTDSSTCLASLVSAQKKTKKKKNKSDKSSIDKPSKKIKTVVDASDSKFSMLEDDSLSDSDNLLRHKSDKNKSGVKRKRKSNDKDKLKVVTDIKESSVPEEKKTSAKEVATADVVQTDPGNNIIGSALPTDPESLQDKYLADFGMYTEKRPRKSTLLAMKKISKTFKPDGEDSSDDTKSDEEEKPRKSGSRKAKKSGEPKLTLNLEKHSSVSVHTTTDPKVIQSSEKSVPAEQLQTETKTIHSSVKSTIKPVSPSTVQSKDVRNSEKSVVIEAPTSVFDAPEESVVIRNCEKPSAKTISPSDVGAVEFQAVQNAEKPITKAPVVHSSTESKVLRNLERPLAKFAPTSATETSESEAFNSSEKVVSKSVSPIKNTTKETKSTHRTEKPISRTVCTPPESFCKDNEKETSKVASKSENLNTEDFKADASDNMNEDDELNRVETPVADDEIGVPKKKGREYFCTLCKRKFRRHDNLLKHQMTLMHISRVSEEEAKERENKVILEERQSNLEKCMVSDKEKQKVSPQRVASKVHKNVAERKSFDNKTNDVTSMSVDSMSQEEGEREKSVLEISSDPSRKTLSTDEALFFECCSLLKESNDIPIGTAIEPGASDSYPLANEQNNSSSDSAPYISGVKNILKASELVPPSLTGESDNTMELSQTDSNSDILHLAQEERAFAFANKGNTNARIEERPNHFEHFLGNEDIFGLSKKTDPAPSATHDRVKKCSGDYDPYSAESLMVRTNSDDFSDNGDSITSSQDAETISAQKEGNKGQSSIQNKSACPPVIINEFEDKFDKIKRKAREKAQAAQEALAAVMAPRSHSKKSSKKSSKSKKSSSEKKSSQQSSSKPSHKSKNKSKKKNITPSTSSEKVNSKKILTKGALKGFDSVKVSINSEEINFKDVLESKQSPLEYKLDKSKDLDASVYGMDNKIMDTPPSKPFDMTPKTLPLFGKSSLKDKQKPLLNFDHKIDSPVPNDKHDIYEFMDDDDENMSDSFKFRTPTAINKGNSSKKGDMSLGGLASCNKSSIDAQNDDSQISSLSFSDRDDFTYMSDDYNAHESEDETNQSSNSLEGSATLSKSSKKHRKSSKHRNIKKNAIMGKIFKNNAIRNNDQSPSENDGTDNPNGPLEPHTNMDQLFDSLFERPALESGSQTAETDNKASADADATDTDDVYSATDETKADDKMDTNIRSPSVCDSDSDDNDDDNPNPIPAYPRAGQRKIVPRLKARSSDDESLHPKPQPQPQLSKKIDIGVASHKSQRKCTTGKQNVLVESWSSESDYEDFRQFEEYSSIPKQQKHHRRPRRSGRHRQQEQRKVDQPVEPDLKLAGIAMPNVEENKIDYNDIERSLDTMLDSPTGVKQQDHSSPNVSSRRVSFTPNIVFKNKGSSSSKRKRRQSQKPFDYDDEFKPARMAEPSTTQRRNKRAASEMLYYWSSSSDDDVQNTSNDISGREPEPVEQHGWIVGDSHKKLVTMLAHAKGRKLDDNAYVKEKKPRPSS